MKVKVTTDWHVAAKRAAGVTPQSNEALSCYVLDSLAKALDPKFPHLIAGDLLDQFTVESATLFELYRVLREFLETGQQLVVLRGNHDFHPRGTQASSFDLLMGILEVQYPSTLVVARETTFWNQFILVPHLSNNDILDLEISKLAGVTGKVVVFHANYDNFHTKDSQHSLNVSHEQAKALIDAGNTLVFGHEHDHRKLFGGKLLVLGNAVPSSISDCLHSKYKYAAYFEGTDYTLEKMVDIDEVFSEVDWETTALPVNRFVRVTGTAKAEQASDVVNAIAQLRKTSDAFIVSNAVKIDGIADFGAMTEASFEDIKGVDVLGLLLEEFDAKEQKVIKELLS